MKVPDRTLRRYLLDSLPEDERQQVEEAYFADDTAYEDVSAAEDHLIDAYLEGSLDPDERARFEQAFLMSAARRERVAFARALHRVVTDHEPRRADVPADTARDVGAPATAVPLTRAAPFDRLTGWWRAGTPVPRWALAGATTALVVAGAWLGLREADLQQSFRRLEAERASLARESAALEERAAAGQRRAGTLAGQPSPAGAAPREGAVATSPGGRQATARPSLIASYLLVPHLVRGAADGNLVAIGRDTVMVRLQLDVEVNSHPVYRPVLETASGQEVLKQRPLSAEPAAAGGFVVNLDVAASLLANGDYVLTLSGVAANGRPEDVAAYAFRVTRP